MPSNRRMPKARTLKTPFGKIAYRESGKKRDPRVLALHGWLDNAASFDRLLEEMSGYHIVAIDFLGHGLSDSLPMGTFYHFIDLVPFLHSVLNALRWKNCIFLGHSMGAAAGCLYAGAFPE